MPIGIRKTQAERLIVAHCAMHGETLDYCNARLREGNFAEIPASSYKTWTRSNTGYVIKLDTKEKIKQHIRSPFPHGSC